MMKNGVFISTRGQKVNALAFDSSSAVLSVALETETGILLEEIEKPNSHSELLMEFADRLCKTAGIRPADLKMVACMKGPGSFTGLRIGFSAAKGIALALGIPLIAVPTLDCLAYPFSTRSGLVIPLLDAKKGCFFAAFYRNGARLTDFFDESPEALVKIALETTLSGGEPVFLTGSGARLFHSRLEESHPKLSLFVKNLEMDPAFARGRARELLEMAKNDLTGARNDIDDFPLYLRKSDAELKGNG
jgi:tRNA threonylcarbamoyladenosine biosynthesis protein TsaB